MDDRSKTLDHPEKLVLQKEGFPYEKYKSNFKKAHKQKLQREQKIKKKKELTDEAFGKIKKRLSIIVDVKPSGRSRGVLASLFNKSLTAQASNAQ